MRLNPIALAIPVFLLAMALELLVGRARRRRVYRLQDSVANLGCGVGQQVAGIFMAASMIAAYEWLLRHAAVVRFGPGSGWAWVLAIVWVDLAYYGWHRLSHRANVLWAVHAVHHQSEDFNLAVALRQAILSPVTSFPFYLPMAVLGVPTAVYATVNAFSTLYQFWIHTELVGKLGPLELVLNTPSAHRVHHAVNPRYLDRNYAAVFIVWDRLFGTYVPERERPVYGLTKPFRSFNPLWAQVQPWRELAAKAFRLGGMDRVRVWWKPPGWSPDETPLPSEEAVQARPRFEQEVPRGVQLYAFVQFVPLIAATFFLLTWERPAGSRAVALAALLVVWTLLTVGGLLDERRWAMPAEIARLGAIAAALTCGTFLPAGPASSVLVVLAALGMAAWLTSETRTRARPDARTVNAGGEHDPGR